jgi:four helix bundle protein
VVGSGQYISAGPGLYPKKFFVHGNVLLQAVRWLSSCALCNVSKPRTAGRVSRRYKKIFKGAYMAENIQNYRDLRVWQRGIELVKEVYKLTQEFPKGETFGLVNQMRRSAVSIPSNIAEGQSRRHPGEFRQFLFMALGSSAELDTQLVIAKELDYITEEQAQLMCNLIIEIRKMAYKLISKLPPSR